MQALQIVLVVVMVLGALCCVASLWFSRRPKPRSSISWDPEATVDDLTGTAPAFDLKIAGITHRGRTRARNEDSYIVTDELVAVADGMGALAGGALASRIAVESVTKHVDAPSTHDSQLPAAAAGLTAAFRHANEAIKRAVLDGADIGGTTLVAARFCRRKKAAYVGNVGDSRCYRLRNGELRRLTDDHGLIVDGIMTNTLTRALGPHDDVEPDLACLRVKPGDVFLLCSDGLWRMVNEGEIAAVLSQRSNPEHAAERLIELANERGGIDNVTAVVVRAEPFTMGLGAVPHPA